MSEYPKKIEDEKWEQFDLVAQECRIATDSFLEKRRKIMNPLRLRYSLHLLVMLIPFGAIMMWQAAMLENAPIHIFFIYVLITFFVGLCASFSVVHRTAYGKQLDALERGDYQNYPELQKEVHELRAKNAHLRELSQKLQKSSYATEE